jgi:D-aminopeptidase
MSSGRQKSDLEEQKGLAGALAEAAKRVYQRGRRFDTGEIEACVEEAKDE